MVKKVIKILSILLLTVLIINMLSVLGLASFNSFKIGDLKPDDTTGATEAVTGLMGSGIAVAQVIGTGVAVIMLIVLATKYMMAAPGDKADIKKHAVPYIVGAVILFASAAILEIIKNFAGNINSEGWSGGSGGGAPASNPRPDRRRINPDGPELLY